MHHEKASDDRRDTDTYESDAAYFAVDPSQSLAVAPELLADKPAFDSDVHKVHSGSEGKDFYRRERPQQPRG
ncbi:MAG TPA: hypothetical protein VGH20_06085 [Myxococcales bacterium]|jgi:hypothetical protein